MVSKHDFDCNLLMLFSIVADREIKKGSPLRDVLLADSQSKHRGLFLKSIKDN